MSAGKNLNNIFSSLKEHFDNIMVMVGVAAFVIGCLLFVHKPEKGIYYVDFGINVKGNCLEILKKEKKTLSDTLAEWQVRARDKSSKVKFDTGIIDRKIFLLDREIQKIETSWDSSFTIPAGTPFRQAISIVRDSLSNLANSRNTRIPFYYEIADTSKYVKSYRLSGHLSPVKCETLTHIDLFKKYPSTAFWVMLSIAQFVFWAIIIGICFSLFYTFRQEIQKRKIPNQLSVLIVNGLVTLIALGVFVYALLSLLYDKKFTFTDFFYESFTGTMFWYALAGYFTTFLFLYGYLLTGYYVRQAQIKFASCLKNLNDTKLQIREKGENLRISSDHLTNIQKSAIESTIKLLADDSEQQATQLAELKNNYLLCSRYFRFFFIISAIVLSVLVIWVGSLFAAVNSMDIFRFYQSGTGSNFLRYDFVYLYGGIHSILLFIFYIPVKLRLISMSFAIPDINNPATDASSIKNFFMKFFGRFIEIITASAPLLTALLQKLIEG